MAVLDKCSVKLQSLIAIWPIKKAVQKKQVNNRSLDQPAIEQRKETVVKDAISVCESGK